MAGMNQPQGRNNQQDSGEKSEYQEKVVAINRCAKVVKGGRRFSFNSIVVIGNGTGRVGIGSGKANEVAEAIRKATENAHKNLVDVILKGKTIPHEVNTRYGAAKIFMRPASPGTGVIAGGAARAVLELAGVHDVLTKSIGSTNPHNVVKAVLRGLQMQRGKKEFAALRQVAPKPAATAPAATTAAKA
jgi:small subunit ribosomal protein S5